MRRRGEDAGGGKRPSRRDEILRIAVELFREHGIAGTGVEAIAGAAGIRPASLYHHFRDKQAIVDAAVELAVERLGELADPEGRTGTALEDRIARLVDFVVDDTALAAVGRHDRVLASPAVRRRAERAEVALVDTLASSIPVVRKDVDDAHRRAMANAIMGLVWSVTHSDLRLEPKPLKAYLRLAARALVAAGAGIRRAAPRRRDRRGSGAAPRAAAAGRTRRR